MRRYEQEFDMLVMVEQRLLNAMSEVRAATRRLGPQTHLHGEIRAAEEALGEAIALSGRAKRLTLHEWRTSARRQAA